MHTFITLIAIAILSRSTITAPVSGLSVEVSTGSGGFKLQITLDISENESKDTTDEAFDDRISDKFGDIDDKNSTNQTPDKKHQLFDFISLFSLNALPSEVVNGTSPTSGIVGARGTFNFSINTALTMIYYDITLHNFQGDFTSPATTATHIHEAKKGASGPPRVSLPNPEVFGDEGSVRRSVGCLKGRFCYGCGG